MPPSCLAVNTNGERCQAQPVRPSGYCYWHDPALADLRSRKRREGGANRSNVARARKALSQPERRLSVAARLLAAMDKLEEGSITPGTAQAIAALARAWATVMADADLAAGLDALRAEVAALKRERPAS